MPLKSQLRNWKLRGRPERMGMTSPKAHRISHQIALQIFHPIGHRIGPARAPRGLQLRHRFLSVSNTRADPEELNLSLWNQRGHQWRDNGAVPSKSSLTT